MLYFAVLVRDLTGSYVNSFLFGSGCALTGFFILEVNSIYRLTLRARKRKEQAGIEETQVHLPFTPN